MSKPNISAVLTDADKLTIKTNIEASQALLTFGVSLNPDERKNLRKTGSKREGYVIDVYNGAVANPGALPANFSLTEWSKDETLNKQLIELRESVGSLYELLDDTILFLGNERISQADSAYNYLKQAAKTNSALTELVTRIGRQFEGQGRKKTATNYNIPAKGCIEIQGVVVGTKLVNIGDAIVTLKPGADLANKIKAPAININPNSSVSIPEGYTSILVSNLSETEEASINVQIK